MSLNSYINIAALGIGGFIVYKSLTHSVGDPKKDELPKHIEFFGDDNMTFNQELHSSHRLQDLHAKNVTDGLHQVSINNGLFELDVSSLAEYQPKLYAVNPVEDF